MIVLCDNIVVNTIGAAVVNNNVLPKAPMAAKAP